MPYAELSKRQRALLRSRAQAINSMFVIVYETQGILGVAEALGVSVGDSESVQERVARYRLSNYLPDGDRLIDRLQDAVRECEWVFLHTGCSICPAPVLELFEFYARAGVQDATRRRCR